MWLPRTDEAAARLGGAEYRLGDLFHGRFRLLNETRLFCERWPVSIGCRYARTRRGVADRRALLDAVARGAPPERPPNDTLVVHLRLGDVLDWDVYARHFGCTAARGCRWVHPLRSYATMCLPASARAAVLVGDPAYRTRGNASVAYRRAVARALERRNLTVRVRAPRAADDDLRFVAGARLLAPARGLFGDLARDAALRRGAAVFPPHRICRNSSRN